MRIKGGSGSKSQVLLFELFVDKTAKKVLIDSLRFAILSF